MDELEPILNNTINISSIGEIIKMDMRIINTNLSIRKSKRGDYIFFKTSTMKKPKFYNFTGWNIKNGDYYTCDLSILKEWIRITHKIF